MLYHLGYVSTQTGFMSADDILRLLAVGRERNERNDITGLLLHRDDSFFQVLEGEADRVRQVFESIKRDRRHHRVEMLFEGPIREREFPDWRMGFRELDGVDVNEIPAFSDFLVKNLDSRTLFAGLSETRRLMLLFRMMK
jgi:hypothetical protein